VDKASTNDKVKRLSVDACIHESPEVSTSSHVEEDLVHLPFPLFLEHIHVNVYCSTSLLNLIAGKLAYRDCGHTHRQYCSFNAQPFVVAAEAVGTGENIHVFSRSSLSGARTTSGAQQVSIQVRDNVGAVSDINSVSYNVAAPELVAVNETVRFGTVSAAIAVVTVVSGVAELVLARKNRKKLDIEHLLVQNACSLNRKETWIDIKTLLLSWWWSLIWAGLNEFAKTDGNRQRTEVSGHDMAFLQDFENK
jgi:hypothetical protein